MFPRAAPPGPSPGAAAGYRPTHSSRRLTGAILRCLYCGTGQLPPTLAPARYEEADDPGYLAQETARVGNADALLAHLPPDCRGRLLEIGCACGFLLLAARRRGFAVEGIEPSRQAVAFGRQRYGLTIQCARIEEATVAAGAYDAVVMADTIEHLPQPAAAIAQAHAALRRGGILLLLTPDLGSWTARCAGRFWWGLLDDHHVYFTRRSLSLLLGAHGYAVERITAHGRRFPLAHWAAKLEQYDGRFGAGVGRLLRATALGRRNVTINLGDQMVCVARRR